MITVSAVVEIKPKESPHRQIWRASENLPAGSSLFVIANSVIPFDTGDYLWFRQDLNYQVVCDPDKVEPWTDYFQAAGGDQGGHK